MADATLRCYERTCVLPNFVLARGSNEEHLPGTGDSRLDGGTNLLPKLAEQYRKLREIALFTHQTSLSKSGTTVIPQCVRSGTAPNV
jgi:hypothetical protein